MRKYGKYERRPEPKAPAGVPAKKVNTKRPQVKSMLLQTYFTSLLCLVLCVTMFFGTSYAWFTSEVNNSANEIYVGTLKVGLLKETDAGTQDLATGDSKLFDKNIRWEPGYTAIETIQIVNEGDLAFRYVMTFTDGALITGQNATIAEVAGNFDVWVFNHYGKTYAAPTSYEEINKANGWEPVGTLADVLEGKTVLSGNMVTVRKDGQTAEAINAGTTDGVRTADKFTIALHMKETAGSEVMGHRISLNVKLVAYQLTSEKDAFGNSTYDDNIITAADAKELKKVLASGKNVVLASNVALANVDECVVMSTAMFDGNGKTITYNGGRVGESSVGVVTTSGGKISNLTINGQDNGRALYVTKLTSDLVVSDCTLSGAYSFNLNSATKNENAIISFIDTRFISWTSYDNVAKHAYFTGCTFDDILRPYGDTTLTNCKFTKAGLDVSKLEAGETITLINCTYNGKLVEKAVLTANGEAVAVTESNVIKVDADRIVVLSDNG